MKQEDIELLIKALEFYADKGNWRLTSKVGDDMTYSLRITSRDSGWVGPYEFDFAGGKRAREVLSQIKRNNS